MTQPNNKFEHEKLAEARESFSGRLLSDSQFEEAIAITRIIEREINKSGAFKDKLGDYAYAMARTERMDALKAETVVRDLFKARTGQTMNQMREQLAAREEKLPKDALEKAYNSIMQAGAHVQSGEKITFYRAFAFEAQQLGAELGITDAAAKSLMRESFKQAENKDVFEWGKELDETYYRPQIEAEAKMRGREEDGKEANHPETTTRQFSQSSLSLRRGAPRLSR